MRAHKKIAVALALAAGLAGAGEAAAGSNTRADTAVVDARDVKAGTVTLSGEVFRVTPTTRILNEKGEPIPLQRLPVGNPSRDDGSVDTSAVVRFEATESSNGWVLERVQVVGRFPD